MKIGISIFGGGSSIPSAFFPHSGENYGKEVTGQALGWGGTFVQFKPDESDRVLTLPTNHDWIHIRVIE